MVGSDSLEQHKLNHYVILDGVVPQEVLLVLNQWLGELSAEPLTETAWVYSASAGGQESKERSRDTLERFQGLSPKDDWQPFRILFLRPRGNGSFSYLMPSVSTSKDSSSETSFTIEEFRKDDPRLREFEIPEEENRSSFYAPIQLLPGSDELEIEDSDLWIQSRLTTDDFNHLLSLGLKGKLRAGGFGLLGDDPYTERTLIVAQQQIKEPVDLPQPDECEVIYYQVGDEWRKFPADARTLKKRFRLSIDPLNKNLTNMFTEASFGSNAGGGGGAFNWERAV